MMRYQANAFKRQANKALQDTTLQQALDRAQTGFVARRAKALELVDDFEHLKQQARAAKERALSEAAYLLERFECQVTANGGRVHWALDGAELNRTVIDICRQAGGRRIIKGKSMVGEETGLNPALEAAGFELVETDLGEYIIQLAQEPPSHIIAPAIHKTRHQVADLFVRHHRQPPRTGDSIANLVAEARQQLRAQFLSADVGIIGANLLVAETGSVVLVTNEGNGDLSANLPRTRIVVASIEKIVATLEDANAVLEVLGRSATGQAMTAYTSFYQGPVQDDAAGSPQSYHVVLLDNGRSDLLAGPYRDILRCIKCGACLNHCPVYSNVGGHAYGSVYPGPMGSVLEPLLHELASTRPLPNASSFCGRCEEVCPMGIPLPRLLRQLRDRQHEQQLEPQGWRRGLGIYGWLSRHPRCFRLTLKLLRGALWLVPPPFWGQGRRPLRPAGRGTFVEQWHRASRNER